MGDLFPCSSIFLLGKVIWSTWVVTVYTLLMAKDVDAFNNIYCSFEFLLRTLCPEHFFSGIFVFLQHRNFSISQDSVNCWFFFPMPTSWSVVSTLFSRSIRPNAKVFDSSGVDLYVDRDKNIVSFFTCSTPAFSAPF